MSREEAKENEKTQLSDKIRLEMALKESAEVAEKMIAKHSPVHTSTDTTETKTASDPWGAPLASTQKSSFDPFAATKHTVQSGFGDAWGHMEESSDPVYAVPWKKTNAVSAQAVNSKVDDPWSASNSLSTQLQQNSGDVCDPWKVSNASLVQANKQSNITSITTTASQQPLSNDPWSTPQTTSVQDSSSDPWGGSLNIGQSNGLKNVSSESFDPFDTKAITPSEKFDPLKDFDQLSIQPIQPLSSAPAMSQDLFSNGVMTPQPVAHNTSPVVDDAPNNDDNLLKAGAFLGTNANLVNIDSLISKPATTHQFITINTTSGSLGANRNPFNQKGPSLSLNQMKTENQNPFNQTPSGFNSHPAAAAVPRFQPSPVSLPPSGLSRIAPAQPNYGMAAGGQQNSLNPFNTQPTPVAHQPGQSLL